MLRTLLLALTLIVPAAAARALDTAPYQSVLTAHAHRGGVDYAALAADASARANLDRYVASLATMPDAAPLADWLNAYNALVIKSIVARWPLASVRDVPGFFDRVRHGVAGQQRTLDDIENRVIRPRFHDARVHFALNCGAVSCPPLAPRAFAQGSLDAALDGLARSAVANDAFVRVTGTSVKVSEIFFWFAEDFVRDAGSVIAWLKRYDRGHRLDAVPANVTLERISYRWAVNDRRR